MPTVEKKIAVRERHEEAIIEFQQWLSRNPKASLKKRVEQFDMFMDTAYLRRQIHHASSQ